MFLHQHPYPPFIHANTEKLIVGTLPPPRFSTGQLLDQDVNFCYGSYYNSLWLYVDAIHQLQLRFDHSKEAIDQRKKFLTNHKIGVCDIVESAEREKIDASDLGMSNIKMRDLISYLQNYQNIHTLLFMGGNSKNGPEYFFRRQLKDHDLKLKLISNEVPRIHSFQLPSSKELTSSPSRIIKTVSLTSPSGSANRAIGSMPLYKHLKQKNPKFTTFDFRVLQYREYI